MKTFKWALPVIILLLAASCNTTKKATKSHVAANGRSIACAGTLLPSETPHLDWVIERDTVLKGYKGMKLPLDYKIYSISPGQLDSFTIASKSISTLRTLVPLPDPVGCQVFNLSPFETMNAQLQAKYPNMITMKGADLATGQSDINISFNSGMIHGQVDFNGTSYIINTLEYRGHKYYLIYVSPTNAATQKTPTGQKGVKTQYDK